MARNVIVLMSDEHGPRSLGIAGHSQVRTPNIDALARQGTRFSRAYCTSPICVPSRAGFATGLYPFQHGCWDNAFPYTGEPSGWGHALIANGQECVSVGKLHYRNETDPAGFSRQMAPMHVIEGIGDLAGMIREDPPVRLGARKYIEEAGEGRTAYQEYDEEVARLAIDWLEARAEARGTAEEGKGWLLFVSFVCPHFPLRAPAEYLAFYPPEEIVLPPGPLEGAALHPAIAEYARLMNFRPAFSEAQIRRALSAYLALVTFMDAQVGKVLGAVDRIGLGEKTVVVYTSDHGDNMGREGLFGKSTMYEDSVGVPLIVRGEGCPAGAVFGAPVSHVDLYPSILDWLDVPMDLRAPYRPGTSLLAQTRGTARQVPVLSEYHGTCSTGGITMLREGRWKYVHYAGHAPQLFDIEADPDELRDLAGDPALAGTLAELRDMLLRQLDPAEVDARAKADQAARIAAHGGREQILSAGTLGYTPAPGETPDRT